MISKRHERLRAATRRAHQDLEDTPLMRTLSEPSLDEAGYVQAIAALFGFWHAHLPVSDPVLQRLEADLASLGVHADALPCMPRELVQPLHDPLDRMARDYLLLGSSLGGTVICRRLGRRFGTGWVRAHASHFGSADKTGKPAWRAYLQRLASTGMTAAEEDRLADTASRLFAALRLWALQMPPVQLEPTATPSA